MPLPIITPLVAGLLVGAVPAQPPAEDAPPPKPRVEVRRFEFPAP